MHPSPRGKAAARSRRSRSSNSRIVPADLAADGLQMRARLIRQWIGKIRKLPLHPQWLLAVSGEARALTAALSGLHGRVLDIGCADRRLAKLLPQGCEYIGLDY